MELIFCQTPLGNFGDDLNYSLWDKVLPSAWREQISSATLFGVGTLISEQFPRQHRGKRNVIAGSGAAGPDVSRDWRRCEVLWLRGYHSTRALGLDASKALLDSAYLMHRLNLKLHERETDDSLQRHVGLIPHHLSLDYFDWERLAAELGLTLISPRGSFRDVANKVSKCQSILSESLHGGIFADHLGIPWALFRFGHRYSEFKVRDWLSSINLNAPIYELPNCATDLTGFSSLDLFSNRIKNRLNGGCSAGSVGSRISRMATGDELERVYEQFQKLLHDAHFNLSNRMLVADKTSEMEERLYDFGRQFQ